MKNICERLFLNFFKKETPTQVFCCEFCELFRNTYFVKDLRTAGSKTPVWGSIFNKVGSQMGWRHLAGLERDSSTGISLWISWNFLERFFCRTPPSNHISHDVYFFFLQISEVCSLKSIYLVEQWQIRRRNSQAHSMLYSYGNQVESSLSSCGHTYTDLGIGNRRKGRTEKFVKVG